MTCSMKYGKQLTATETRELFMKGDKDAVIVGNLTLAHSIAKKYMKHFLSDDILAQAFLGLVLACNGMPSHDNVQGYISTYIHGYIQKLFEEQAFPIKIPNDLKKPETIKHSSKVERLKSREVDIDYEATLYDVLNHIELSDFEEQILFLYLQNFTDSEIGQQLGFSQAHIWNVRNDIFNRIKSFVMKNGFLPKMS